MLHHPLAGRSRPASIGAQDNPVNSATDRGRDDPASLEAVERERIRRSAQLELAERLAALKVYQQSRFFIATKISRPTPRHAASTRFFLKKLYSPGDFSRRDAQFVRIVPAVVRQITADNVAEIRAAPWLKATAEMHRVPR